MHLFLALFTWAVVNQDVQQAFGDKFVPYVQIIDESKMASEEAAITARCQMVDVGYSLRNNPFVQHFHTVRFVPCTYGLWPAVMTKDDTELIICVWYKAFSSKYMEADRRFLDWIDKELFELKYPKPDYIPPLRSHPNVHDQE